MMAFYLVRARPRRESLEDLERRLWEGQFRGLRPFGPTLSRSLERARFDTGSNEAVWEEEDYCTPPLAQERAAVLDRYFEEIRVEPVTEGAGWSRIEALPSLWDRSVPSTDLEP
jgi:hypothetical protein